MKITFLTGAGISASAGISTFRDSDGLWERYDVHTLASIKGFKENTKICLDFYNDRRKAVKEVNPTYAHRLIAELERNNNYDVQIITQNVDDLHERAGSTNIIHFHGEIFNMCNESKTEVMPYDKDIVYGVDFASDGTQLRPNVVMFGENIPVDVDYCEKRILTSDIVVVIGTSLQVYPFAFLAEIVPYNAKLIFLNKEDNETLVAKNIVTILKEADKGIEEVIKIIKDENL